jgi:hypothetical protein
MGQGTESCGGYDCEYDEYEEGLLRGVWTQRKGGEIHVSKMKEGHLRAALRMVEGLALSATFSSEQDKWQAWAGLFEDELSRRSRSVSSEKSAVLAAPVKAKAPVRGAKVWMICHCGKEYQARTADLKRGYGFSCNKSCAAVRREFGRPAAKRKL